MIAQRPVHEREIRDGNQNCIVMTDEYLLFFWVLQSTCAKNAVLKF